MSNSIFPDLNIPESDASPAVLLSDDFASLGALEAPTPSKPKRADDDPIEVMRKIFVGRQVDEVRDQIARLDRQISELRELLTGRMQDLERSLREDMTRFAEKTADAVEQGRSSLVASVDDRLRKVAASSVPRHLLGEILKDLSSRLQSNAS